MNKLAFVCLMIGIGAILFQGELIQVSEALYSIPPTVAWKTIEINNDAVFPSTGDLNVTAIDYHDKLFILTDGSILLNITEFTP